MSESITFLKLAEMVIDRTKRPLSYGEIWDEAVKSGLSKRVNTKGKTPWNSIGAQIYMDIRDNPESIFFKYSKRPAKFFLNNTVLTVLILKFKFEKKSIQNLFGIEK